MNKNEFFVLGFIAKTHGIKGDCILRLEDFDSQRIKKLELVFLLVDDLPVPFFISSFSSRDADSLQVKFEDVDSDIQMKEFTGCTVLAEKNLKKKLIPKGEFLLSDLVGFTLVDEKEGEVGTITEINDNSDNPLICISKGREEIIVPLNEDFIVHIDEEKKELHMDLPEGLLDINS